MAETIQQGECIEKIMNAFAKIGHELTNKQAEQFFQYYEMLVETNKVMNLTAITEFDEVLQKHFVDSVLKSEIFIKEDTKTLIDVGTGAGFPGVPLKIMYPQLKVTLLDSLNKRLNFLNQVIEKLGLENITTVHYRAEDGARKAELREQFDCVVSRAVANMSTLCEYCLPYAKVGGCFVAYKSGNAEEEIDKAKKAVHLLGGVKENAIYFDLPDSDIGRSLVIVKKKEPTSKKYPRKAGLPSKKPTVHRTPQFAKPHVPCVAAKREQSSRAALSCSLTGVHFVLLICQILMQAWDLSRSDRTCELVITMFHVEHFFMAF